MDVFHPKMLTRIALIYLEEAILDVLFKASNDEGLMPAQISELIGISSESYKKENDANPIVHSILYKLRREDLVEHKELYREWNLTDKGIKIQRDKYHANIR